MTDGSSLAVADVVLREDLYPRSTSNRRSQTVENYQENLDRLPPIEVNQRNELIDGWHRWTAYKQAGRESIPVVVTETKSDTDLLELACERNASHGYQLQREDKKAMFNRIYHSTPPGEREVKKEQLLRILALTERTIRDWSSRIDRDAKEQQQQEVFGLWLSCWTRQEIADRMGMPKETVRDWLKELGGFGKLAESAQLSAAFGPPYEAQIYNVWKFRQKSADQTGHAGNSDQRIVEALLHSYTEPLGDIVVDPFGGGGSTIDVCKARFRRYYVSDLTPLESRAHEIRQHDLTEGVLSPPRWKDVKLVYLDPPYWKQAEGWYGDSPSNLSNMTADGFHETLARVINGYAGKLHSGAKVALLLQPTQWKAPDRGFVDHTAAMIKAVDLPIVQRVQCPYESQQATPQMVEWAKANRQWLVLSRELTIWEVA